MTNYLLVQGLNIAILILFACVLLARTRAEMNRKMHALQTEFPQPRTSEQRTKIETLQHELEEIDRGKNPPVSPIRPS